MCACPISRSPQLQGLVRLPHSCDNHAFADSDLPGSTSTRIRDRRSRRGSTRTALRRQRGRRLAAMDLRRARRRTAGTTRATSRVDMAGPAAVMEDMAAIRRSQDTTKVLRRSNSGTRAEADIVLGMCSRALAQDIMAGSRRISPPEVRLTYCVDAEC